MTLQCESPCKVNLLLNILGKRADGFHELESVMFPVPICDRLEFGRRPSGIELTCIPPVLATDSTNLVHRAASAFFEATGITDGARIHLEKTVPLAAGLGGGSSNAAATLRGLNELFDIPLNDARLHALATALGSDVPFFLQGKPALAMGRGERIVPLEFFPMLRGVSLVLVHPGFGVSTAWAYQRLARFPAALNGRPGRARRLVELLQTADLATAGAAFYNALEAPVLDKFPLLALFQEFFRANGAVAALMSGSGSTTFALVPDRPSAEHLADKFAARFGATHWWAHIAL